MIIALLRLLSLIPSLRQDTESGCDPVQHPPCSAAHLSFPLSLLRSGKLVNTGSFKHLLFGSRTSCLLCTLCCPKLNTNCFISTILKNKISYSFDLKKKLSSTDLSNPISSSDLQAAESAQVGNLWRNDGGSKILNGISVLKIMHEELHHTHKMQVISLEITELSLPLIDASNIYLG